MSKESTQDLLERFEGLEVGYKEMDNEVRMEEAVLKVTKKEIKKGGKNLEERGVDFSTLKELKEIEKENTKVIEEQVVRMEELIEIDEEDEEFDLD